MIDLSLIREVGDENPDLEAAIVNSVLTLANSGILERQLSLAFESIASGSVSEDASELAARILRYRQENHGLIALQQLAKQLKERNNA